jgi:anti-anti-sigma factor
VTHCDVEEKAGTVVPHNPLGFRVPRHFLGRSGIFAEPDCQSQVTCSRCRITEYPEQTWRNDEGSNPMGIQNGPDGAILVDLPEEPALEEELGEVLRLVRTLVICDVVLDFAKVTILNSTCLAALLRLRNHLQGHGGHLVLCNIGAMARSILSVTGLTGVFETTGSKLDALAAIRRQAQTACP